MINYCLLPLASCLLPLASCLFLRDYIHYSKKNPIAYLESNKFFFE
ncbi:MAG: hypothetical protein F6K56_15560 [Moorea sp. SIO3G5]|nr:hypothetical protein [Moorena sp. SIO3G5]